jgi:uncharacterized repeat protein (TIGR03803 family)
MERVELNRRAIIIAVLFCTATVIGATAQTYKYLASFNYTNGAYPTTRLVQGPNGNLYGTTTGVSGRSYGTIFQITTSGSLASLYSFCSKANCIDGATPLGGLMLADDSNFYGTTSAGGTYGYGTVFKMTPTGKITTLYSFCPQSGCPDGETPTASLVQGTDGNFYGTTSGGGANGNYGTVFKITTAGKLTTLYSFCSVSSCNDGENPQGGLIQGADGNFYGTTSGRYSNQRGSIFEITPGGEFTTLYTFCSLTLCADGTEPTSDLVQAADGNFYGTASGGGPYGNLGTVFEFTPGGVYSVLYGFSGACCGEPYGGLAQGTDGNLYGTTYYTEYDDYGTAYEITPAGVLSSLYLFCRDKNCSDGESPYAGLMQATNGIFYGTTSIGGASDFGTVFSLSTGLGPFVTTLPTSGGVGSRIAILGTNLGRATTVSFNGIPAAFSIKSSSAIETSVPIGATTGNVQVTTPAGTLTSNVAFSVP